MEFSTLTGGVKTGHISTLSINQSVENSTLFLTLPEDWLLLLQVCGEVRHDWAVGDSAQPQRPKVVPRLHQVSGKYVTFSQSVIIHISNLSEFPRQEGRIDRGGSLFYSKSVFVLYFEAHDYLFCICSVF